MKQKIFKILKIVLFVFLGLFILLSILPYLLPVNKFKADSTNLPFSNSRFINLDGKKWHYLLFEPKDSVKGNILLIHGFSGSTFSWRKNQEVFADSGYRVLSVDLPAFGFSEKENNKFDHSAHNMSKMLVILLDSLNLSNEKWTVMGHSMGASVAWNFAENYSNTNHVFLVSGAGSMGNSSKAGIGSMFLSFVLKYPPFLRWIDVIAGYYFFKQPKFEELLASAYNQKVDSISAAGYLQPFLLKKSGSAIIEGFLYNMKSPEVDANKIQCPVYLIWGTEDKWVPIKVGKSFLKKYPKATMKTIEKAGHCTMETHPEIFNEFVLERLR